MKLLQSSNSIDTSRTPWNMNGVLYSGVLHALLFCAYLQNCRAQVINLEFGFVFPSLNVTEGESVRVCLSIQSLQLQPQLLAGTLANLTVEFITADTEDINSNNIPQELTLANLFQQPCINIETFENDDGNRFSEKFLMNISVINPHTIVSTPQTIITILERRQDSDFCDFDQTVYEGVTYSWPESVSGDVVSLPCPQPLSSFNITRMCDINGEWQILNSSACEEVVTDSPIPIETQIIVDTLQNTTADPSQQTSMVLDDVASEFESIANSVNVTITQQVVSDLVDSLSIFQQWTNDVFGGSNSSSRIIQSFEIVAARYAQDLQMESTITVQNQIVFTATNVPLEMLRQTGLNFRSTNINSSITDELSPNSLGSVSLPANLFLGAVNRTNVSIFFTLYTMPTLFPLQVPEADNDSTTMRVVGSSVIAATAKLGVEFDNVDPPIVIRLQLTRDNRIISGSESCVFWDFSAASGQGNWSSEGCTTVSIVDDVVTCHCTHLTNFAILVDICLRADPESCRPSPVDEVLSFVSYIGVSLSMLGLLATIITMLAFKRKRKLDASKYHIQLSIAIFCMLLVFAVGVEQTSVYAGCMTVSVLIHYFTLVAVMWMGAEALLLFQKLVFVFKKITKRFIIIISLICWLVPLVPVLISLIIDLENGNDPSNDLIVERDQYCFLSHQGVFFGAFLGPIFAILLMNVVLCVIVIAILIKHFRSTARRSRKSIGAKKTVRLLTSIIGIMTLFGLSWLFGALTITVSAVRTPAQIIFVVLNSFQGFFIFLFFCVISREARESWKQVLTCGRYQSAFLNQSTFKQSRSISHTAASSTLRSSTALTLDRDISNSYKFSTLQHTKHYVREQNTNANSSIDKPNTIETVPEVSQGEKPGVQIKRYSTKRAKKHHVEEFELKFSEASSDEETI